MHLRRRAHGRIPGIRHEQVTEAVAGSQCGKKVRSNLPIVACRLIPFDCCRELEEKLADGTSGLLEQILETLNGFAAGQDGDPASSELIARISAGQCFRIVAVGLSSFYLN